ncbi:Gag polyprotein [Labeo rohita]|uniref:Gag polyprotein n=1 Tax=Labeo rohita TaxID=84645 RepID=A0ABQ8L4M3_LABRO|nr:Gag polyprotein [Labeo rohita]
MQQFQLKYVEQDKGLRVGFESDVTSELQHASKGDLTEGVLKILKNIMGPKIDWSRITNCVQRKEETVNEYTERFCQTYSGIVDDPESVLDDKGPLVRIWSDGLVAEYRKALPFLDLAWSNRTLRSNLDCLATWERDSDAKARVKIAAASFQVNTKNQKKRKCPKREGSCHYCSKLGHWMKECKYVREMNSVNQLLFSLFPTLKQTLPTAPNSWGSLLSC